MPQAPSFIHGATYYHFAHSEEEFPADFARMRELGLNAVRVAEIWPGWEVLEPRPGRYDFAPLDHYVAQAAAAGLKVIMGLGINNPPPWIFHDLADVRCVGVDGRVAMRRVQSANHDHPGYRKLMERFVEKQVRRYRNHKAIIAWQFGNEVRYGVDLPDNRCTRLRFRRWLKDRYGASLEQLNRDWGTVYRSWEELQPYCSRSGAPTEGLSPLAIATRRYLAWSLAELISWGAKLIRRHSRLPVFHNNHSLSGETYSHWDLAEPCDLVVCDLYPAAGTAPQLENTLGLDLAAAIARSQGKPFWIGETSIGQYGTYSRNRPPVELVEALVFEMFCAGAGGLLYFRHRAPKYEQPHKFTGSQCAFRRDGSPLPYARTPQRLSALLERLGARLSACSPVAPEIAAYYPEESLLFSRDAGYHGLQRDALAGTSALWNRAGLPLQYLNTETLLRADLSACKLLYLPLCYLLPSAVGKRLGEYARAGGTLVSECRPGYVDEHGWLYERQPGAGLDEVFGAREDLFWNPEAIRIRWRGCGVRREMLFPRVCQTFRLFGAQSLAETEDGETAGAQRKHGGGRAILLGFAPSLLFSGGAGKYHAQGNVDGGQALDRCAGVELIAALAKEAGLRRPVPWSSLSRELSARYLESAAERFVFLCNHGEETEVELPAQSRVVARRTDGELRFPSQRGAVKLPRYGWLLAATERRRRSER